MKNFYSGKSWLHYFFFNKNKQLSSISDLQRILLLQRGAFFRSLFHCIFWPFQGEYETMKIVSISRIDATAKLTVTYSCAGKSLNMHSETSKKFVFRWHDIMENFGLELRAEGKRNRSRRVGGAARRRRCQHYHVVAPAPTARRRCPKLPEPNCLQLYQLMNEKQSALMRKRPPRLSYSPGSPPDVLALSIQ